MGFIDVEKTRVSREVYGRLYLVFKEENCLDCLCSFKDDSSTGPPCYSKFRGTPTGRWIPVGFVCKKCPTRR